MDDLSLHGLIGARRNIKNVQRITVNFLSGDTSKTINLSDFDLDKTVITRITSGVGFTVDPSRTKFSGKLQQGVTKEIVIKRASGGTDMTVEVEITEFNNVKSLQRGNTALFTANQNILISQVDMSKSLLFAYTEYSFVNAYAVSEYLEDSTHINIDIIAGQQYQTYYELIEFI